MSNINNQNKTERKWKSNRNFFAAVSSGMFVTAIFMDAVTGMSPGTILAGILAAGFAGASIGSIAYLRRIVKYV